MARQHRVSGLLGRMDGRGADRRGDRRRGAFLPLVVLLLIPTCGMVALAVDLGFAYATRTQLQAAADSGALAGAAVLYPQPDSLQQVVYTLPADVDTARSEARTFVRYHSAAGRGLDVTGSDVEVGRLYTPTNISEPLAVGADPPNTVKVTVPMRDGHPNGPVGLFFARVLGFQTTEVGATAMATVWYPALLPFATSVDNWESLGADDDFAYNPGEPGFGVSTGSDGISELRMFPGPWNGQDMPPGNFGVIEIGPGGSTMTNVRRQIDAGPSLADLDFHGGSIESGMDISGRTGLKSSAKIAFLGGTADSREFSGIVGQVRQLPLYDAAAGNGSNATFRLAGFVTVRVMALEIDGTVRTDYYDTEGNEITAIIVQPVTDVRDMVQVHLTR
ncbi:MAG: pilus assembly protein TadG-related protein [Pirellulales bacterium]